MRPRNSGPLFGACVSGALSFALLAGSTAAAQVSSAPLAQVDAWGVGWIGANEGAVPATFWSNTSGKTLGPVMAAIQPRELAPSARDMLARILMSRSKGPADGAELTAERLRLLEQLGDNAHAVDLRKRYPKADWGKPGDRLGAELALLQGDSDSACASAKSQAATDADWMPLRAVCATLGGDANSSLIVEQIARTNESLGVWLIGALGVIASPDTRKPDGRFSTPVEAAVSVAARLPASLNQLELTGLAGGMDLVEAAERRRGVLAGDRVELDLAGPAVARRAGFVEADVAGAADAEDLQVDAADGVDFVFVGFAVGEDLI